MVKLTEPNKIDIPIPFFLLNRFQEAVRTMNCSKPESVILIRNNKKCI